MEKLCNMTQEALSARAAQLQAQYDAYCAQNLTLDMSRGKPGPEQLDLTLDLLTPVTSFKTESGMDVRNYGGVEGIPEARALFGDILGVPAEQVLVGGNSSLNMMFDYIATAYAKGVCGHTPWVKTENPKFICPVPGYDRHFAITQYFGIEMVTVPMTATGPDMDRVESLVKDPSVKGMWCVPMYSNPDGITYSDETVRRLAAMETGADDFRIIWDNAYCLHHVYDTHDTLLNMYTECERYGHEDRVIMLCSTSKISFPGAGVAALAASPANIADILKRLTMQTIGYDKINMLRHVNFFRNIDGVNEHMKLHAAILRPKFDVVLNTLQQQLGDNGVATWHKPNGGYFISVNLMEGCAKRTVQMLKDAGVILTPAGSTYPYKQDPHDSNLRIAPTFPTLPELQTAINLFCIVAELVCIHKLLNQ